jgi:transposase
MQGKVSPERSATPVYVGIDVCKAWLDVYLHPIGHKLRVANDRLGLRRLKCELARHRVALVVLEATGKFHREAHRNLHAAGLAVAVVNPLRSRLFAQACGALAKTDDIDARLLALLAESLEPAATPPLPEAIEELQELVNARAAAVQEATAIENRLGASQTAFLKAELARQHKVVKRHIARLQAEIVRRIAGDPVLARRYAILISVPGIGPIAAIALLTGLPELGQVTGKAASLMAGLAPIACDSGERTGQRRIRGGRAQVRTGLYWAAVTAARCNPGLKAFYERLRGVGKTGKVAITAVMRKLVVLANTLLREDRLWQPDHA